MKLNVHSGSLSELLYLYEGKLRSETTHMILVHNQKHTENWLKHAVIVHIEFPESSVNMLLKFQLDILVRIYLR